MATNVQNAGKLRKKTRQITAAPIYKIISPQYRVQMRPAAAHLPVRLGQQATFHLVASCRIQLSLAQIFQLLQVQTRLWRPQGRYLVGLPEV